MDPQNCDLATGLVSKRYINQGSQAISRRHKLIKTLLSQRKLPEHGWDDATIEMLLQDASFMDSNNFLDNAGVGEREGRVASQLVARRHYNLAHGVGRSGDITAEQPKAAGSSLLASITSLVLGDALQLAGLEDAGPPLIVPLATGMALTLGLLALQQILASRLSIKAPPTPRYVLWSRIDQKTCLKSITAAGFLPIVIPLQRQGDQLVTDMQSLHDKLHSLGPKNIAAIVSTTSCFAPRAPDNIISIAKLCQQHGIAHIINNAYGIQSRALCNLVTAAWRRGRVDLVVQSTDKNFMVPVGGAILVGPSKKITTQESNNNIDLVGAASSLYPGRASAAAMVDVLITLLHWGRSGWLEMLVSRENVYQYALESLLSFGSSVGERVLHTPDNPISLGLSLDTLTSSSKDTSSTLSSTKGGITYLGSMLFNRCISGARVVGAKSLKKEETVAGIEFTNYGAHYDEYPCDYLTIAAALGCSRRDIDLCIDKLRVCFDEHKQHQQHQL